jgi:hypothetical protein
MVLPGLEGKYLCDKMNCSEDDAGSPQGDAHAWRPDGNGGESYVYQDTIFEHSRMRETSHGHRRSSFS